MPREVLGQSVSMFVEDYVESFLGWDVILLFFHNPNLKGDAVKIANFLGRKSADLGEVLEDLVKKGLLKSEGPEGSKVYFYAPKPKLSNQVSEFVRSLDFREKRLAVLTMLLEKTR